LPAPLSGVKPAEVFEPDDEPVGDAEPEPEVLVPLDEGPTLVELE
jgi:hypothetical protein